MADQIGTPGTAGNVGNPPEGAQGGAGGTGGAGGVGAPGRRGLVGARGPKGDAYSSWLTRNVLRGYLLLAAGVIAAITMNWWSTRTLTDRIEAKAMASCEAGNERSQLQADDYRSSLAQLQQIDLETLFNIGPDQAAEFRRLSIESSTRRIAGLPFLDCRTGKRIPAPVSTTTTTTRVP